MRRLAVPLSLVLLCSAPAAAAAATGPCRPGTAEPRCHVWKGKVTFVADGDTLDVDLAGDGSARPARLRLTGVQAMEQTRYSRYPSRRRGACHALEATARVERLLRPERRRVRVVAQDPGSRSRGRLRRAVYARVPGGWRDIGAALVAEGHALWSPAHVEWAWNRSYSELAGQAAAAGRRLYDTDACGPGPGAGTPLSLQVNWDADGNDGRNVNGEYFDVRNGGSAAVALGGWWVRDSHLRRYTFPAGARVEAGGRLRVRVGRGDSGAATYFWGLDEPVFENASYDRRWMGDGGYLFDPRGNLRAWDIYP